MLKVEMDALKKGPETLTVSGEMKIVAAEIGEMIHRIYNLLLTQNEDAAVGLRVILTMLVAGTDSPVWKREEMKGTGVVAVMPDLKKEEQ